MIINSLRNTCAGLAVVTCFFGSGDVLAQKPVIVVRAADSSLHGCHPLAASDLSELKAKLKRVIESDSLRICYEAQGIDGADCGTRLGVDSLTQDHFEELTNQEPGMRYFIMVSGCSN